jgi:hypothetical protein
MGEHTPETQPSGALTPPPRVPPTAVATSAPFPWREPGPRRTRVGRLGLREVLDAALDGLDALADRIADAAGLR